MTFFASIQVSLSTISLRPMSQGLSFMNAIGGGGGGGAGNGARAREAAGRTMGGRLDPDNDKSDGAGITKPIMEEKWSKNRSIGTEICQTAPHSI